MWGEKWEEIVWGVTGEVMIVVQKRDEIGGRTPYWLGFTLVPSSERRLPARLNMGFHQGAA